MSSALVVERARLLEHELRHVVSPFERGRCARPPPGRASARIAHEHLARLARRALESPRSRWTAASERRASSVRWVALDQLLEQVGRRTESPRESSHSASASTGSAASGASSRARKSCARAARARPLAQREAEIVVGFPQREATSRTASPSCSRARTRALGVPALSCSAPATNSFTASALGGASLSGVVSVFRRRRSRVGAAPGPGARVHERPPLALPAWRRARRALRAWRVPPAAQHFLPRAQALDHAALGQGPLLHDVAANARGSAGTRRRSCA